MDQNVGLLKKLSSFYVARKLIENGRVSVEKGNIMVDLSKKLEMVNDLAGYLAQEIEPANFWRAVVGLNFNENYFCQEFSRKANADRYFFVPEGNELTSIAQEFIGVVRAEVVIVTGIINDSLLDRLSEQAKELVKNRGIIKSIKIFTVVDHSSPKERDRLEVISLTRPEDFLLPA
ncbi:MAG: hypothetical protein WC998_03340 [Candidatus Paceibacterota bacterium]|jgi:hypothetical protein